MYFLTKAEGDSRQGTARFRVLPTETDSFQTIYLCCVIEAQRDASLGKGAHQQVWPLKSTFDLGSHIKVEGENQLYESLPWPPDTLASPVIIAVLFLIKKKTASNDVQDPRRGHITVTEELVSLAQARSNWVTSGQGLNLLGPLFPSLKWKSHTLCREARSISSATHDSSTPLDTCALLGLT